MNSIWMLAAAEAETQSQQDVITMEEAPAGQQSSTTQQDGSNGPGAADQPTQVPQKPNMMFIILMGVLFVYMFFVMFRGPKKKQQEHQKMVQSLKKNDRVRTIGGILGTVMDVRDDEIILKIDESTNTKMRVIPAAIATVLSDKTE